MAIYNPKASVLHKKWDGKGECPAHTCIIPACTSEVTNIIFATSDSGIMCCQPHYDFLRYTLGLQHVIDVEEVDPMWGGSCTMNEDYPRD